MKRGQYTAEEDAAIIARDVSDAELAAELDRTPQSIANRRHVLRARAATPSEPRRAGDCICGKHMLERLNEGTCLSCGHGHATLRVGGSSERERLPRNLGELDDRPDPGLPHVLPAEWRRAA